VAAFLGFAAAFFGFEASFGFGAAFAFFTAFGFGLFSANLNEPEAPCPFTCFN